MTHQVDHQANCTQACPKQSETLCPLPFLKGKAGVVLGLGQSGQVALKAAKAAGARVTGYDDSAKVRSKLKRAGFDVVKLEEVPLTQDTLVVVSPGVAHTHPKAHPLIAKAKAVGARLLSDVGLFFHHRPKGTIIGVSGTNGKSSTVALMHFILQHLQQAAQMGGNIGLPVLGLKEAAVTVLELSSYQIETAPALDCDVSVLLRLAPDHLDRYASYQAYTQAKLRLLQPSAFKAAEGFDVWGSAQSDAAQRVRYSLYDADDPLQCAFVAQQQPSENRCFVPFAMTHVPQKGFALHKGVLYDTLQTSQSFSLKAAHRLVPAQALLAAFATLRVLGHKGEALLEGAALWPGLAHRLERLSCGAKHRLCVVNDSKATNMASAAYALSKVKEGVFLPSAQSKATPQPCFWLCGGALKEGDDMALLVPFLPFVTKAFVFGEGADVLTAFLHKHHVSVEPCSTLEKACSQAAEKALKHTQQNLKGPPPLVLLSPGGASFDAFTNFKQRGEAFKSQIASFFASR
ncbi:MAG: UDP-N-acetylmuramoyl-L-alanine--D-glutamate ligase [Holosporaceae bacterium]